jgi:hypothetical protein
MDYCSAGGMAAIHARTRAVCSTAASSNISRIRTIKIRKKQIETLYDDKPRFIRLLVLYIGMFTSFLADPHYYLRGIDRTGLHPVTKG